MAIDTVLTNQLLPQCRPQFPTNQNMIARKLWPAPKPTDSVLETKCNLCNSLISSPDFIAHMAKHFFSLKESVNFDKVMHLNQPPQISPELIDSNKVNQPGELDFFTQIMIIPHSQTFLYQSLRNQLRLFVQHSLVDTLDMKQFLVLCVELLADRKFENALIYSKLNQTWFRLEDLRLIQLEQGQTCDTCPTPTPHRFVYPTSLGLHKLLQHSLQHSKWSVQVLIDLLDRAITMIPVLQALEQMHFGSERLRPCSPGLGSMDCESKKPPAQESSSDLPILAHSKSRSPDRLSTLVKRGLQDPKFEVSTAPDMGQNQPKRSRTRLSEAQLGILRSYFDISNSPSDDKLVEICAKTGLQEKVVKHWFRNTLFKERQKNKDNPYNFAIPPSTSLNLEEYEKTGRIEVRPASLGDESKSEGCSNQSRDDQPSSLAESDPGQAGQSNSGLSRLSSSGSGAIPGLHSSDTTGWASKRGAQDSQAGLNGLDYEQWIACRKRSRLSGEENPLKFTEKDGSEKDFDEPVPAGGSLSKKQDDAGAGDMETGQDLEDLSHENPTPNPLRVKRPGPKSLSNPSRSSAANSMVDDDDDDEDDNDDDMEPSNNDSLSEPNADQSATATPQGSFHMTSPECSTPISDSCISPSLPFLSCLTSAHDVMAALMRLAVPNQVPFFPRLADLSPSDHVPTTNLAATSARSTIRLSNHQPPTFPTTYPPFECIFDNDGPLNSCHFGSQLHSNPPNLKPNPWESNELPLDLSSKTAVPTNPTNLNPFINLTTEDHAPFGECHSPPFIDPNPLDSNKNMAQLCRNSLSTCGSNNNINTASTTSSNNSSGNGNGNNNNNAGRRNRTSITSLQSRCMHSIYAHHKTPSVHECDRLGEMIGLTRRVVQVWFQNQRAKEKKMARVSSNQTPTMSTLLGTDKIVGDLIGPDATFCPICAVPIYSDLGSAGYGGPTAYPFNSTDLADGDSKNLGQQTLNGSSRTGSTAFPSHAVFVDHLFSPGHLKKLIRWCSMETS